MKLLIQCNLDTLKLSFKRASQPLKGGDLETYIRMKP
jgi:hypothetical protein